MLKAVPVWVWALAAALAWGGWQKHQATEAQRAIAEQREEAMQATITETARRLKAQEGVTRDADKAAAKARASAASAAASVVRLRERLAATSASADPTAPSTGEAARLADLLGQCADRYVFVAGAADRAIVAGQACERAYESLKTPD